MKKAPEEQFFSNQILKTAIKGSNWIILLQLWEHLLPRID